MSEAFPANAVPVDVPYTDVPCGGTDSFSCGTQPSLPSNSKDQAAYDLMVLFDGFETTHGFPAPESEWIVCSGNRDGRPGMFPQIGSVSWGGKLSPICQKWAKGFETKRLSRLE